MQALLKRALQDLPAVELIGITDTARDALAAFDAQQPDVVILDLVLREGNGLTVLQHIKQGMPACQVWIFTAHDGEPFRRRCAAAGADCFFSKNSQHQVFLEHLRELDAAAPASA